MKTTDQIVFIYDNQAFDVYDLKKQFAFGRESVSTIKIR